MSLSKILAQFGESKMDLARDKERLEDQDMPDVSPPSEIGSGTEWEMSLKKKRRSNMMKQLLKNAGYDDLARMVNLKEK